MSEINSGTHLGLTSHGRAIYIPVDVIDVIDTTPDGRAKIWLRDPSPVNFTTVDQTATYVMLMLNQVN